MLIVHALRLAAVSLAALSRLTAPAVRVVSSQEVDSWIAVPYPPYRLIGLVDISSMSGDDVSHVVRSFCHCHPEAPVIGFLSATSVDNSTVMAGTHAGISAFLHSNELDRSQTIRAILDESLLNTTYREVHADIEAISDSYVRGFVHMCFWEPGASRTAEAIAAYLFTDYPRVARAFRESRFPLSPKQILVLARMFAAIRLLLAQSRPVDSVAHRLGYASEKHFREMLNRYVPSGFLRTRDPAVYLSLRDHIHTILQGQRSVSSL